jgi:hypothetical protein
MNARAGRLRDTAPRLAAEVGAYIVVGLFVLPPLLNPVAIALATGAILGDALLPRERVPRAGYWWLIAAAVASGLLMLAAATSPEYVSADW